MKNLSVKLSVAALLLGVGSALATSHHSTAARKWGKDPQTGVYTEVTSTPGYLCESSINVCTEEYPSDVNPNDQAHDDHTGTALPSNPVAGDFSL